MKKSLLIPLILIILMPGTTDAASRHAWQKARQGLEDFRKGDYEAASKSLGEADAAAPDEARITFDAACAAAAAGEIPRARELFDRAGLSEDPILAARCRYNLGCLSADEAEAIFGDKPEETPPADRAKGLDALKVAASYYRQALELNPEHKDATYNIETIQLWADHMNDVWLRSDRRKQLEGMHVFQLLDTLQQEQEQLRTGNQKMEAERDTPLRRQNIRTTAHVQKLLADDMETLKAKVQKAITDPPPQAPGLTGLPGAMVPPGAAQHPSPAPAPGGPSVAGMSPGQPPAGPPAPPQIDETVRANAAQAMPILARNADSAGESMTAAANHAIAQELAAAADQQALAIENLDEMHTILAPYIPLVELAIKRQEASIQQAKGLAALDVSMREQANWNDADWRERFVTRYSHLIPNKARIELKKLESMPTQGAPGMPPGGAPPVREEQDTASSASPAALAASDADHGSGSGAADAATEKKELSPQEKAAQQREALKKALNNAVKYSPDVERLTTEAATLLADGRTEEALPKQEEALRLLKEMLPKNPNQDKNKNQDQNKDKDKDKNKDQNKDKDKKPQDENEDKKNKDEGKDQDKDKNKDKEKGDQKDQQQQPQPKPGEPEKLSKEQMEALLRKARQREQEHRDIEKAYRILLQQQQKTDRDW